jgi:5-methylcytosine-specific restriction endonuclease McrA
MENISPKAGVLSNTQYVYNELKTYGLTLLNIYVDSCTPLIYECTCGGIGKTKLSNIKAGKRCGHCAENKWINLFKEYNCTLLTFNTRSNIQYICHCGNVTSNNLYGWLKGDKRCSACRVHWNFKPDKIVSQRPNVTNWKTTILARDGYSCKICASNERLQIHHIEAYSVKPELISEVSNGITLCYTCHKSLHSKYGHNVGKTNLIIELEI